MREQEGLILISVFFTSMEVWQMKKVLVLVAAALLFAGVAFAQVHYEFHCTGSGNMAQDSPVVYGGQIDGGDLAPGTWTITVDDTGWPPTSTPVVRYNHIWAAYYVYDPGPQMDGYVR
jgi:hypothetical protein